MSNRPRRSRRTLPTVSTQATAVFSVSMVLLILGIVALLTFATRSVADEVRSAVGYVVVVKEHVPEEAKQNLRQLIMSSPATAEASYASAEEVLTRWEALQPGDSMSTGIIAAIGINPFSPEWEVKVKSQYASSDSLQLIVEPLRSHQAVDEIVVHHEMIDSINSTLATLTMALLIVGAALLLISLALINNTVRLSVYARRFTIYTMKLVGATPAYIRRPFVNTNIIGGAIAALFAFAILAMLLYYSRSLDPVVTRYLTPESLIFTGVGMLAAGMLICGTAAWLSATKYIRTSYDDMFGR